MLPPLSGVRTPGRCRRRSGPQACPLRALLPPLVHPGVEDILQVDMGQPRRGHCPSSDTPPSAISASDRRGAGPLSDARRTAPSIRGRCCPRKPPHTTHPQHFPERVTITRPHHPFQGQSLEVLRQARMPGGLQFVLILPDGRRRAADVPVTSGADPQSPATTEPEL